MSDYEKFMSWLKKTYPTHARAYSSDPVIQSAYFAGMAEIDRSHNRQKNQSFCEKHPHNPNAMCKCEHWQACINCHPTYIEAAIRGEE